MRPRRLLLLATPLAAALAATAPAASAASPTYAGSLSRGSTMHAIVFGLDPTGQHVETAVVAFTASCDDGKRAPYHANMRVVEDPEMREVDGALVVSPIQPDGRFYGTYTGRFAGLPLTAGITARVSGNVITGSLSSTFEAPLDDGTTGTTSCFTGTQRFGATRKPGIIYGGWTSQDEPVAMRLDSRRTKVRQLLLDWHATCRPSGYFDYGDPLVNFPIRGGRFGDRWSETRAVGGQDLDFTYQIAGRVTRSSSSGRARLTVADTSGSTSCPSGAISWRATSG